MRRVGTVAAAFAFVAWLCAHSPLAMAQTHTLPELQNANVAFDYYEPRDAAFLPLYEKLQRRQVLEELSQFLAPVHWPKKLRLIMKECPSARTPDSPEMSELIFYDGIEYSLTLCYQLFQFLEKLDPPAAFATRQEVIVGGLVGVVLHEAGRAMFDMLDVPVLGSEDDAADQIAGFIGLQFGNDVARTVIKGTYSIWDHYNSLSQLSQKNIQSYNFAGASSLAPQRAYNLLCIAYGRDAATFQDLVDSAKLPPSRAEHCADEYHHVQMAFEATILKNEYVDLDLMEKVQSMTWVTPDDLQ